jgi:molecular chaperone HtpG
MYRNHFLTKEHSYYDNMSILLHQTFSPWDGYYWDDTFELYCVSGKRFENKVKFDWPNVKINHIRKDYDNGFNIIGSGSVHGTLCLICSLEVNIILWNPSTKEIKVIPHSPIDSGRHWEVYVDHLEFGYDRVKDDYKVMRHIAQLEQSNISRACSIWEVYSLRSNSWKKLDVDMHNEPMGSLQLYMDGLSHWLSKSGTCNEASLISLDWSNEVFITTPIPSDMNDDIFDSFSVLSHLVLLNGSIALILKYRKIDTFHISILGELGVKESWTKLFIVGPLPCLEYPIGTGKKGDIFFKNKDGGLVLFDLNTQMIVDLGISQRIDCKIVIHKENLLPFEGKNM